MGDRRHPLRPFARVLRRHVKAMALGTAAGIVASSAALGLMALSGWFISAAAFAGLAPASAHLFNFFLPSIGVRIFAILRTLSRYIERVITHDATFRILEGLRVWFYESIEPLAPAGLWRFQSGDVLNRVVADIEALDNFYLRVLSPSAVAGVTSLVLFFLLGACDLRIGVVGWLVLAAAGLGTSLAAAWAGEPAGRLVAARTADLRARLIEGLQGIAEISLFGAEAAHRSAVRERQGELLAGQNRMAWIKGASTAANHVLLGIALLAVLYLGCGAVADGSLDGAKLAVIVLAVMASFESVFGLPSAYQHFGRMREAGRRLLEVTDAVPAVTFSEATRPLPDGFDLIFDRVGFRYQENRPAALCDVTFEIPERRRTAVIGESGAGKSTLVNLLVRFFDPTSGSIRIGGTDIRTLGETDLRRSVVVLSQQAHLFCATIRENLLIGKPDADETQLRQALAGAHMLDFVDSLPEGLDTWLGEAGQKVSAGQARRLGVARAILRDAPIWVLDEPSEGLDRITERRLVDSLLELTRGRTVLFITHRLEGLQRFDQIVVLEGGRVADQGRHTELLERNQRYARWCARMM